MRATYRRIEVATGLGERDEHQHGHQQRRDTLSYTRGRTSFSFQREPGSTQRARKDSAHQDEEAADGDGERRLPQETARATTAHTRAITRRTRQRGGTHGQKAPPRLRQLLVADDVNAGGRGRLPRVPADQAGQPARATAHRRNTSDKRERPYILTTLMPARISLMSLTRCDAKRAK